MQIFVFGNRDLKCDRVSPEIMKKLKNHFNNELEFVFIKPNEDLPFGNLEHASDNVVILDIVRGLQRVSVLNENDLDKLKLSPRTSVHNFDLGFQLKYLKKLGKLGSFKIIGVPMSKKIDYSSIHSIVKKLVAQDIQGS
jgi:Ni,Fe-hydrogenase maturation factor